MFGSTYYHGIIRRYVIAFANLFNDIIVVRRDQNGIEQQRLEIPIAYGPKEKFYTRMKQDPNLDTPGAISLPRIGFEITGFNYAPERKLSSTLKQKLTISDTTRQNVYVPVPYNITFGLSIFSAYADDSMQILEQILPYFRPEFTTNVNLLPSMNIVTDTPVVLQGINIEDRYEGDFETRRAIIHTLDFNLLGYIYGPTTTQGVITRSIANIYDNVLVGGSPLQAQIITNSANGAYSNTQIIEGDIEGFELGIVDVSPTVTPTVDAINSKSISILDPDPSIPDDVTVLYANQTYQMKQITAVIVSPDPTASITFNLYVDDDRSAAGTPVRTENFVCTSQTTGDVFVNSFPVPDNNYLWLEVITQTGTIDEFHVTVEFV